MVLRMNKKGQADFIGNFLSTIPKPILFIFFIVMLSFIASLLSPLFQGFGIYCDSDAEVVKLENSNLFSNFGLMSSLPDADEIGGTSLTVPDTWYNNCLDYINGSQRIYGGGGCVSCDYFTDEKELYCIGDAYKLSNEDKTWWKRNTCGLNNCKIPEGYYFSVEIGKYACLGEDCSGKNLAQERDAKLDSLGAVILYPEDVSDNSAEGFFRFGCNDNLKPEITLKGIPLFRLEYWAILILITIMLLAVMNFRKN